MAITLTPSAAERVKNHLHQQADATGLRLGVKKTGCSGFAYVVDYAHGQSANDVVFEDQGVQVVVDRESLPFLDGTQVDFVKKGLNESFQFKNPNVKDECGCGESFTV
ncbi:MAG TPA: iron-sulfur cluster assembly accessory protein [Gammaproteobacteria bacterium]|nr:iron-sulfur cluster assembly accessory protein [Gammaproteobacteria bacterium]